MFHLQRKVLTMGIPTIDWKFITCEFLWIYCQQDDKRINLAHVKELNLHWDRPHRLLGL